MCGDYFGDCGEKTISGTDDYFKTFINNNYNYYPTYRKYINTIRRITSCIIIIK